MLALLAVGFGACSQKNTWSHEERKALREALRSYREMVYLENLTDAEYLLFADAVADELENDYPVYATFLQMPGLNDTVDMVVVTTIVEQLNADARNMRHIYPYESLVKKGILPAGLDHKQLRDFYKCFASKVNKAYPNLQQFVTAVLGDTSDNSQIRKMQSECANNLFNWVVTEVDIVETAD